MCPNAEPSDVELNETGAQIAELIVANRARLASDQSFTDDELRAAYPRVFLARVQVVTTVEREVNEAAAQGLLVVH
jgi:hypothetical protein